MRSSSSSKITLFREGSSLPTAVTKIFVPFWGNNLTAWKLLVFFRVVWKELGGSLFPHSNVRGTSHWLAYSLLTIDVGYIALPLLFRFKTFQSSPFKLFTLYHCNFFNKFSYFFLHIALFCHIHKGSRSIV
jgi:hypothetical protein